MTEDEAKIDPSKIRVGDEVDVRMKVAALDADPSDILPVRVAICGHEFWIGTSDIIAHHPRQLQVGDKVRSPITNAVWEITGHRRALANGVFEYPAWRDEVGFNGLSAEDVESWERVQ